MTKKGPKGGFFTTEPENYLEEVIKTPDQQKNFDDVKMEKKKDIKFTRFEIMDI